MLPIHVSDLPSPSPPSASLLRRARSQSTGGRSGGDRTVVGRCGGSGVDRGAPTRSVGRVGRGPRRSIGSFFTRPSPRSSGDSLPRFATGQRRPSINRGPTSRVGTDKPNEMPLPRMTIRAEGARDGSCRSSAPRFRSARVSSRSPRVRQGGSYRQAAVTPPVPTDGGPGARTPCSIDGCDRRSGPIRLCLRTVARKALS